MHLKTTSINFYFYINFTYSVIPNLQITTAHGRLQTMKASRSCWMNTGTNKYDVWAIAFMFGVSVIYVYQSIG